MRRSMLFLPGNNPNMLINASCLGADAVIFDLEDAVAPAEKDAARILVRNTMRYMDFSGCEIIVRINSIDTPYWKKDIDQILPYKPGLILLPKTGSAQDALEADAYISAVEEKLGFEKIGMFKKSIPSNKSTVFCTVSKLTFTYLSIFISNRSSIVPILLFMPYTPA